MHQYSLDKSSKKFICPSCQKKTFVRYFDNEQNSLVEGNFGRCDRESNCKYHLAPKHNGTIATIVNPPVKIKASTLNPELLNRCKKNFSQNNLVLFLRNYFSDEEIESVIEKYFIGTSVYWKGATVFWQINSQNEVMAGKVMLYNQKSGSRIKKPSPHITWVHKILKIEPYSLQQCLFGLHLKNANTHQTIAITESEKTTVMMSLLLPEYTWMATGGKANLKRELLLPIKEYNIVVYPDKSEFDDWNKITVALQREGFRIRCSQFIENRDVQVGTDLADIYLEAQQNNYTIPTQRKQSKVEIEVQRLAEINPEILTLISVFDLLDENDNPIVKIK
ncbi:DUF6371 domain-containing protein [Flavobacterium sp. PL12]|uniref:DUF6371 domain-containing protein n=1 Tax=Flavobacterium sp. PL12 TaxID=3071718 RepID=UPI00319E2206